MKAIMLMFDSLNRHFLPNYGCNWVHAPNFQRLAARTATFDSSYIGSMPCMPCRRDLHTGRLNFLHRSWGPLEPFDDSAPEMLALSGVYTHLVTDHYHYWEDGGGTYHTRYNTWEFLRGQEGDPWMGQVADPAMPQALASEQRANRPRTDRNGRKWRQDFIQRQWMDESEDRHTLARTIATGIDFVRRNADQDNWFLHLECFDPHEPFYVPQKYRDLYPHKYAGPRFDWPPYRPVKDESPEAIEHIRLEYAALVSMCDAYLGKVLDMMDELDLWKDTMLIINCDHGHMLGEKGCWAKCWQPWYQELANTPLWIWDPRSPQAAGQRRESLVQAMDWGPTLLEFFGVPTTKDMLGKPLGRTVANDTPVHEALLFGLYGVQVNVTDGRYVYMRSPVKENQPLYEYTLMPTHMMEFFDASELQDIQLAEPFSFTKGCRLMKIPAGRGIHHTAHSQLWDVKNDPHQERPINDPAVEKRMIDHLVRLMKENDAPAEQFARLGLQ